MEEKDMNRFDVLCGFLCTLLFIDMIATNASAGPSIVGWWILLGIFVMLPHGFITSELSAAYPEQGGVYVWVQRAYGNRMAARTSYIYWINNTLWMPSATIWVGGAVATIFFPTMSYWAQVGVAIALIWISISICCKNIDESKWSNNLSAIAKVLVGLLVIGAGVTMMMGGTAPANPLSIQDMLPSFSGGQALVFVPSVVYLCFGAEVLAANAGKMKNPKRDIPRSMIMVCGITVLISALGAWAMLYVIPVDEINLITAPFDMMNIVFGSPLLAGIVGTLLILCVITSVIIYVLGTCVSASEAGKDGEFPAIFAKESKKTGAPIGALLLVGIIATLTVLAYGFMAGGSLEDLFFTIFAFTTILYFIPYIIMHSAYRKLKRTDKTTDRPYIAPFGTICSYICQVVLVVSMVLFIYIPGEPIDWTYAGPVLCGVVIALVAGELLLMYQAKKIK